MVRQRVLVNCAGIGVAKRVIGRDGHAARRFRQGDPVNLIGSSTCAAATAEMSKLEPLETGERRCRDLDRARSLPMTARSTIGLFGSKGGIVAMTLPIAREAAQFGIRVLTIRAGPVPDPAIGQFAAGGAGQPGRVDTVSAPLGHADEFASLALHMIDNPYLTASGAAPMPRFAWRRAEGRPVSSNRRRAARSPSPLPWGEVRIAQRSG